MHFLFCFLIFLLFQSVSVATDELIIVQSISSTRKSFVIQKGMKEGISKGQISLFGTSRISFSAISTEVNRNYSVWTPQDPQATIPFTKGEIITYTNSIDEIWNTIPYLKINQFHKNFNEKYKLSANKGLITLQGSFGKALYETTSGVDSSDKSTRSGQDYSIGYGRIWLQKYEALLAIRFDQDTSTTDEITLSIPTQRTMILAKFLYHLSPAPGSPVHFFGGIYAGFGESSTTIDESTRTGNTYLFPGIEVGIQNQFTEDKAIFLALSGEGLFSNESFEDGEKKEGTIYYTKLSLGLKF